MPWLKSEGNGLAGVRVNGRRNGGRVRSRCSGACLNNMIHAQRFTYVIRNGGGKGVDIIDHIENPAPIVCIRVRVSGNDHRSRNVRRDARSSLEELIG